MTQNAPFDPPVNVELLKTKLPVEVFEKQLPPFPITQSAAFIVKVADPVLRTTFCTTPDARLRKTELLIVIEPEPEHVIAGVFAFGPAMTWADSSVNPAAPVTVKHPEVPARRSQIRLYETDIANPPPPVVAPAGVFEAVVSVARARA
jgi:hypothetical protein